MIKENLDEVISNIKATCQRIGRNEKEITLIAVSKTKPVEDLQQAMDYGIIDFGENKVQELVSKIDFFDNTNLNWHMIGHLQTNKVKYIVGRVCLIHSVDSLELARKISNQAVKTGVNVDILLEVNMALEDTKFGINEQDALSLVKEIAALDNITVRGLMTVAPYVEDPQENRPVFRKMKELLDFIRLKEIKDAPMDILSMGMTNDYIIAIEEGSTMVRVGSAIFGNRIYNK